MIDPHRDFPVEQRGKSLADARIAVVLLHGRGSSANDILSLASSLYDKQAAYLAPQAAENTWYPFSFLAPIAQNEPWLSSAIAKVEATVARCVAAGLSRERVIICGFSQGACLGTEFAARHPSKYGALVAFTGGLIGPSDSNLHHAGSLDGTPALLSSGDPDPHVPWERVKASAGELERMGARVELMRHAGRQHTIVSSELQAANVIVHKVLSTAK